MQMYTFPESSFNESDQFHFSSIGHETYENNNIDLL